MTTDTRHSFRGNDMCGRRQDDRHATPTETQLPGRCLRQQLLDELSHRLRTPLNVVVGYNEMLLEGTFGPLRDEQLETLLTVRGYHSELVDTLCEVAEILADRVELEAGADDSRLEGQPPPAIALRAA